MMHLAHVLLYLAAVAQDGDYLNDWLRHVNVETAAYLEVVGRHIAAACGC